MDYETIQGMTTERDHLRLGSLIVSLDVLRELLHYDPITGNFRWLTSNQKGKLAGTFRDSGYGYIKIYGIAVAMHTLAWFYIYGVIILVDHKNGRCWDNRIDNLRPATVSQNNANRSVQINNMLQVKGVRARGSRFEARIRVEGREINLGRYNTIDEASQAYMKAAILYFGEFARGQ